ncbi:MULTISPECIES: hypothetical protein [unclassified Streptomyces]|uniref:hypothetical protein n=1 Tax=unclassified Streptomyces TaxID=2593676 RepID=UPI0037FDB5BB
MPNTTWSPALNGYAVDISNGRARYGKIVRTDHGLFILRPPGGGAEWPASRQSLREPDITERGEIRTLITPVPYARRAAGAP